VASLFAEVDANAKARGFTAVPGETENPVVVVAAEPLEETESTDIAAGSWLAWEVRAATLLNSSFC
jgi:hypothetical protein